MTCGLELELRKVSLKALDWELLLESFPPVAAVAEMNLVAVDIVLELNFAFPVVDQVSYQRAI